MTVTVSDDQRLESFLPVYDTIPDKWEDAKPFLVEQFKRIALAVNIREIGWHLDEELLSGKAFIPGVEPIGNLSTSQVFRQVLRKVINFGALPAAGTKSVPHGIVFDANFTLIHMYASETDPTNFVAGPVPQCDPLKLSDGIKINMDVTNVNITVGVDMSSFTRCFVTIEYLQEL